MTKIQKPILPMKGVNISRGPLTVKSHKYIQAIDMAGEDGGKEWGRAPTRVKVLKILTGTAGYNTILFGTCDESGNKTKVLCADGIQRVLTFAFTHDDSVRVSLDDMYEQESIIYMEGSLGADGNHIHVEVAENWQYGKISIARPDGSGKDYVLSGLLEPERIFWFKKGYNSVVGRWGLAGLSFKETDTFDEENDDIISPSTDLSGCYLNAVKSAFRVRFSPVTGTQLELVPIGGRAEIKKFLGIQSDGYQWVQVSYVTSKGCVIGYSQMDTKNCYTLSGACSKTLYLYATKSAFRLRTSAPSGSQKELCPVGGRAKILYFGNIASDGYQWAYVEYNGVQGWSQMDTKNCYTVNI